MTLGMLLARPGVADTFLFCVQYIGSQVPATCTVRPGQLRLQMQCAEQEACLAEMYCMHPCLVHAYLCFCVRSALSAGEAKDLLRKAREAQKTNTLPAL